MLSRAEALQEYGSDYFIQQKIENGELFKIEKGIYSEREYEPELALICYKYPKAVVTMNTAFYHYGLTDEIPDEYFLATKRESAPIADSRVKQVFMSEELLDVGKTQVEYKGYFIPIFDKERMLIELIRYKSKLPFNYYKEIIGNFRRILPRLNPESIRDYAEVMPKKDMIIKTLRLEVF